MTTCMRPTHLAFGAGLVSAAGVYVLVLGTLLTDYEWWPPGERNTAYYCHWTLVGIFDVSLAATAVLDWGSWGHSHPAFPVVGGSLAALGMATFVWGTRTMRTEETMGVTGNLYTHGPYAYTRNPQYLGMIVGLVGFALVADSVLVAALVAAHVGWVLLLPRAEEPHLREEFGDAYDRYASRVPRFVGWRTLRRAFTAGDS